MKLIRLAVVAACLGFTGCYRTTYANLQPPGAEAPVEPPEVARTAPKSWQHFFIFGWVPDELVIDAAAVCGGAEHVKSIQTRETFLQGLVTSLAGFYINIYSPWTGAVDCDHTRPR